MNIPANNETATIKSSPLEEMIPYAKSAVPKTSKSMI